MTQLDLLAQFGFSEEPEKPSDKGYKLRTDDYVGYAPKSSFWRDKDQQLWIADGQGVFTQPETGKTKAEGWVGDNPGHGLARVECFSHSESHEASVELLCHPLNSDVWPPQESDLTDLVDRCKKKGILSGWLQEQLERHGAEITRLGVDGWPRGLERFTWLWYESVKREIIKVRMIGKGSIMEANRISAEEEALLQHLEQETREEHVRLAIGGNAECGGQSEVSQSKSQNPSEESQSQQTSQPDTDAQPATSSSSSSAEEPGCVQDAETSSAPIQVQGEVMPDLPAIPLINEDGEVSNLQEWLALAGIKLTDDTPAVIGKIRRLQGEIEEICIQTVKMIKERLIAVGGLTAYFSVRLTDWAEPQMERWASDSKPGVKNPHKKGEYKKKNVRSHLGAVFFKQIGGAMNTTPGMTREFIATLRKSEYERYGVREKVAVDLPEGFEIRVFEHGSPHEIDSEDFAVMGITIKRELSYSKRTMGRVVEDGEHVPGWHVEPFNPLGKVTIGGERAWSWNVIQSKLKDTVKLLTLRGEDAAADSEVEDEE